MCLLFRKLLSYFLQIEQGNLRTFHKSNKNQTLGLLCGYILLSLCYENFERIMTSSNEPWRPYLPVLALAFSWAARIYVAIKFFTAKHFPWGPSVFHAHGCKSKLWINIKNVCVALYWQKQLVQSTALPKTKRLMFSMWIGIDMPAKLQLLIYTFVL